MKLSSPLKKKSNTCWWPQLIYYSQHCYIYWPTLSPLSLKHSTWRFMSFLDVVLLGSKYQGLYFHLQVSLLNKFQVFLSFLIISWHFQAFLVRALAISFSVHNSIFPSLILVLNWLFSLSMWEDMRKFPAIKNLACEWYRAWWKSVWQECKCLYRFPYASTITICLTQINVSSSSWCS